MTREERTRLANELAAARDKYGPEFNQWYSSANFPDIESYCRYGWLLDRVMDEVE